MTDRATPNLPSRDFEASSRFYGALGFVERFRNDGWMILERGTMVLKFFPHHPGGIPALPDAVTREAYSHEV